MSVNRFRDVTRYCRKSPILTYRTRIWRLRWGDPGEISLGCLVSVNEIPWVIMWCCLLDPRFSRFSRTPTCDRQTDTDTDGNRVIAYTALAWCRAVKNYKNRTILARVIAHYVVWEICKGDNESLWERGKFDPPLLRNPLTDNRQKLCVWLHQRYLLPCNFFIQIGLDKHN